MTELRSVQRYEGAVRSTELSALAALSQPGDRITRYVVARRPSSSFSLLTLQRALASLGKSASILIQ